MEELWGMRCDWLMSPSDCESSQSERVSVTLLYMLDSIFSWQPPCVTQEATGVELSCVLRLCVGTTEEIGERWRTDPSPAKLFCLLSSLWKKQVSWGAAADTRNGLTERASRSWLHCCHPHDSHGSGCCSRYTMAIHICGQRNKTYIHRLWAAWLEGWLHSCVHSGGQTIGNTFQVKLENSSKNREKCCLFLDIFSSAIMNDLIMTFTSRLKMDAKCANQQ